MSNQARIFLGLGSNIHDRYKFIKNAIIFLNRHPHIWVISKSHIYQTSPMYNINQNEFYNMVVEINTNLNPLELLETIQDIEKKVGRSTSNKNNMPREIDIDILTFDDIILNTPIIRLPHPKIIERKFVLKPWNDIASSYIIPGLNKTIAELLNDIDDDLEVRMLLID